MGKGIRVTYYLTTVVSALVGLWHFFVPHLYEWYRYLPMQYTNLIVGIDYTNYCFSLLLFGLSIMLVWLGKKALQPNREVVCFYYFFTVVWVFRGALATFIEPIAWAAILQLVASDIEAALCVLVSVSLWRVLRQK